MLQKTQGSAVGLFDCKWYWGLLIFCWPCLAADFQIVTVTHWFTGSRVQLQISKNSCQLLRYKGSFAAEPCQKKYSKDFFSFESKMYFEYLLTLAIYKSSGLGNMCIAQGYSNRRKLFFLH